MSEDRLKILLEVGLGNAITDLQKIETSLKNLDQYSTGAQTGLKKISDVDFSRLSGQIDAISGKLTTLGGSLTLAAAPFEAYGAIAVKAFSDFESGIAKIGTLLPDATQSEMDAIGEQLKGFSTEFGSDISSAIQAYYDALSAGVSQSDVLPFIETAQKAGAAGMSDVSVAVDALTSVINAYQKDVEEAGKVSDVMFKTVELGKIEFDELAANIGKVAPSAAAFGVSFEDVGAAISAITALGVSPSETMTSLKALFKDLGKSGTELNEIFTQLSGQGFSEFIKGGGTLVDAVALLKNYSDETGKSFFDMTTNFESANALAMLGGPAFESYAGMLDKITDSAGATDKAFERVEGTMAYSMNQLKAQLGNMAIEVGEALAPAVAEFTDWLKENTDEITEFAVTVADNVVPVLERLLEMIKGIMDAFNNLSPETKDTLAGLLGTGIGAAAIGGPALLGAGLALSPISSLVSILAGVGPAATIAATSIPKVTAVTTPLITELSTLAAVNPAATLGQYAAAIGPEMAGATTAIDAFAISLGGLAATGAGVAIGAWVYDIGNFRDEVSKLPGDMAEIAEGILTALSGDSSGWGDAGKGAASLFVDGFNTGIELIKASPEVFANLFGDGAEAVGMSFTGLVDGFYQAFKDRSGETISVGKPDVSSYEKAGTEAGQSFVDAVNSFFSSNPITAPGVEAGEKVAEEINRINQQVVIDQNRQLSDTKAWRNFEGSLADALISSGKKVRTFSSQTEADMWNAANEWQEAFKKSGMGFEDWLNSLNSFDGQKFQKVAQDFSSTFGIEIQKVYEMFANHEIVPLKFDTSGFGNVYYEYENGVYQPIMNNPVMIQVDEGTASGAFQSLVDQWEQVKAQIEGNPANPKINVEGSQGNLQKNWENSNAINPDKSTWQYSNEEVKLNPITGKYEKVVQQASEAGTSEGAKQGVSEGLDKWLASHGKPQSDIDAILKSPSQTAAYQKLMDKELNKEWGSQKESSSGLSIGTKQVEANTEEVKSNTKGQEDLAQSFKSLDEAIAHVMTTDKSSFVYDGKKYGREQNDDGSYSWQDQSNIAKEQRSILEKQQKEAEKTSTNTEELGLQFQKGVSVQEAMLSAIQQYGGINASENKRFTVGEDTYKIKDDGKGNLIAEAESLTAKLKQGMSEEYNKLIDTQGKLNDKLKEKEQKLSTAEFGSTQYKNLQTDINNLKNEIRLNKAEIDSQTKSVQNNAGTTTRLDSEQLKLIDSVDSTSKGIFEFSEPVKTAGESTGKLAEGSDNATGALQTFADSLGNIDLEGLMQSLFTLPVEAFDRYVNQFMNNKEQQEDPEKAAEYRATAQKQYGDAISQVIARQGGSMIQQGYSAEELLDRNTTAGATLYTQIIAAMKQSSGGYTDSSWFRNPNDWATRQSIMEAATPEEHAKAMEVYQSKHFTELIQAMEKGDVKMTGNDPTHQNVGWSSDVQLQFKDAETAQKYFGETVDKTGTEAKTTTPQINTLNSAFEKIGLTGSGLTDVLSNVNQSLSDHHANILESKDYLTKYNDAAGENVKYTQDQERQTNSLMNSLGMLGTAQDMYNNYMSDGVLDATEASHVQQALAQATKMMGEAGIDANTNLAGLPGALQALASAAQAAMSQIQAAISQAQSAASAAASGWKMQTSPTKYPTIAPPSPTNFTVNMNGNSFPAGTKPGDVIRDLTGQLRIVV